MRRLEADFPGKFRNRPIAMCVQQALRLSGPFDERYHPAIGHQARTGIPWRQVQGWNPFGGNRVHIDI